MTAWLPTLVPDSKENYLNSIDAISELIKIQTNEPIAQILGVHYEGVFANTKMCGALRPQFFKTFENGNESTDLPKLETGIHFTTLAPEIENGIELIKELVGQNWIVSIGHTGADAATLDEAKRAGAKHVTHFFNAMTGIHHRDLGVAGWALTNKEVTFDIIADGIHVAPEILEFACRVKSSGKVSLISDSVSPTGLGDGEFEIWGEKVSVVNGKTRNERGSIAGSVITMLDAVRTIGAAAGELIASGGASWPASARAVMDPRLEVTHPTSLPTGGTWREPEGFLRMIRTMDAAWAIEVLNLDQLERRDILGDVAVGAGLERAQRVLLLRMHAQHQDADAGELGLDAPDQFQAWSKKR